jgi:hypothetical protein
MYNSLAQEVARLRREVEQIKNGSRIAHGASIENAALEVKDSTGALRVTLGVQPDGTVGVVAQNGPPPGALSAPIVTPSIAGLRVTWDGALADGSNLPLDFDHVAVHVSTTSGFTPSAATFVGTITRAGDGGMLPVTPLPYALHYVRLIGVNTSGIGGDLSAETAGTPVQVDGPDLTAGSVTAGAIAAGAVEADKLAAILVLATRILAGDPAGARVELNGDGLRVYDSGGALTMSLDAVTGDATFTGTITGSAISGSTFHSDDGAGSTVDIADGTVEATASTGWTIIVDPTNALPIIYFKDSDGDEAGAINATGDSTRSGLNVSSGPFTDGAVADWRWVTFLGEKTGTNAWHTLRMRESDTDRYLGGWLYLDNNTAQMAVLDSANPSTVNTIFQVEQDTFIMDQGRLLVGPRPTSFPALFVNVEDPGQTGPMLTLQSNGTGLFTVGPDGTTTSTGPMIAPELHGTLVAPNIAVGSVSITPSAASVPTSFSLTGLNVAGTSFKGFVTAATTVPGVRTPAGAAGVTGVGITSVTSTGALIWLNRENTTATTVNWMIVGS